MAKVLFKRGIIFVTFFSSCVAIALLLASIGTKHWVVARAKRLQNNGQLFDDRSDGRVNFGLFAIHKELNVAYGWRTYEINVSEQVNEDSDFILYNVWLGTIISVFAAVLLSGISAIFAVVNTATTPLGVLTGVPGLYLWNILAFLTNLAAIGCWLGQYFFKLQYNVMPLEDRQAKWTSDGLSQLGFSFWFVVGAAVISFFNTVLIYAGTAESEPVEPVIAVVEEKSNGVIMLY